MISQVYILFNLPLSSYLHYCGPLPIEYSSLLPHSINCLVHLSSRIQINSNFYTVNWTYPCSMKNTTEMIRQTVEMVHPMYETICRALRSTSGISYQEKFTTWMQKQPQKVSVICCDSNYRPLVLLPHPLALQSWWDGCFGTALM